MPDLPSPLITTSNGSWASEEPDIYRAAQGFKIISATIILHIQLFDQYLDFKIDSLGATWAGCWVLFWHGYWIQLCTQLYRTCRTGREGRVQNSGTPFSVEKEGDEFIIRGSCSPHAPRWKEAVLEECWTGKLLLAESNGEWMRLFRRNQTRKKTSLGIMVDPEEAAKKTKGPVRAQAWLWLRLRRFLGNLGMKDLESLEQTL
jgi:hypothetical protein